MAQISKFKLRQNQWRDISPFLMLAKVIRYTGIPQGFPKLIKSCSRFSSISPITVDTKSGCIEKIGYSVQGLVAKLRIQ
jgi:hypothetical protein